MDRSHYQKRTAGELTPRQQDVLALMARGKTNREIGDALGISLDGAKFHVSQILVLLGVDSRVEAVARWPHRQTFSSRARRLVRATLGVSAMKWTAGAAVVAAAGLVGVVLLIAVATGRTDEQATVASMPTQLAGAPITSVVADAPVETRVVRYIPDARLAGAEVEGNCFNQSLAAPWRFDAWRCSTNDERLYDPCFSLNAASVLCGVNPEADATGFVLRLHQSSLPDGGPLRAPASNGWLIRLVGGVNCAPATGTTGSVEGKRANYHCSDGRWILGEIEPGAIWRADVVELGAAALGSAPTVVSRETVAIETVWQ